MAWGQVCLGARGRASHVQNLQNQSPARSRSFRHSPVLSRPRAVSELQTDGACRSSLGGGPPRTVAGAPRGAQRGGPWRAAGSGSWRRLQEGKAARLAPRSRRPPFPLKARPVSSPPHSISPCLSLSLHLSVSVSLSPTSPLSHTHIALAIFLRSCIIFSRKMSLHLPRGISSECLLTPPWGDRPSPAGGVRKVQSRESGEKGSRTRGDMAADTSPRKTDVIPAPHAIFRGVHQAGMTVCDLQSRRFKPVEVK